MQDAKSPAIFQAENGALELRADANHDTIWATQKQMAQIFSVSVKTISEHISTIFKTNELDADVVIRKFQITASDGKKYNIMHYNLDLIISVGYRVNSKKATEFRRWATSILKSYITEGFAINRGMISNNYTNFLSAIEDIKSLIKPTF